VSGGSTALPGGGSGPVVTLTGGTTGTAGNGMGEGGVNACETVATGVDLEPVYLVFAFDVSGSMGQGDFPWHDRTLKWDPVVAATKAFFEDPKSTGLHASLVTFPHGMDGAENCDEATYAAPDVPMTALPSEAFGVRLDTIGSEPWRGGTPTLAVVRGSLAFIEEQRDLNPGRYALVLVTDGFPQGCDDQAIASVVDLVTEAAPATATYVVGVENPPIDGAPDTVSDLGSIAEAGGTEAILIDTGNPSDTTAKFQAAIELIRGEAVSCTLPIPPPPDGREFDKQRVRVSYESGSDEVSFSYDAECLEPDSWHYDDVDDPTAVVLCDSTCATVQADTQANLSVEFACENVIELR
jgi:hypothetical protein